MKHLYYIIHQGAKIFAPKMHNPELFTCCWISDTEAFTKFVDEFLVNL